MVTGAGSGIGGATARRMARDGFAIGVVDLDGDRAQAVSQEIEQAGGRSIPIAADVRSEVAIEGAVSTITRELGQLYALVNSAGILHHAPSLELDLDEWRRQIDVNLTGTFVCARAAARAMVNGGSVGRIVNIASVHSLAPGQGLAAYDASKGGIWMLTRSLALEFAPYGIAVNAVGPGLIGPTGLGGGTTEEYLQSVVPAIPFGRAGQPDEVAGAVSFLCSSDASYITGAMLFVDGGMLLTART